MHTPTKVVFFSGYHGWNDWYLAANIADSKNLDIDAGLQFAGVPRELHGTSIPFNADHLEELLVKIKGKEKK